MSTTQALSPFHLAFPVHSLKEARSFYGDILGWAEGRSSPEWIDFNFYGHQIVAHLAPAECQPTQTSEVDSKQVPVRHFGVVRSEEHTSELQSRGHLVCRLLLEKKKDKEEHTHRRNT